MQKVTSKDGTKIAYEKIGQGPAVILIDGAMGSRASGWSKTLADLLASDFTVYYYDRRGRGDSGDNQPYAVEREIEDIEALIGEAGGSAYLYGISSGACLALEATIALGSKVEKLAMYEAPYDSSPEAAKPWRAYRRKLEELIEANKRGDAVALFMRLVGVPEEMITGMQKSPEWIGLEAIAHTLPYDAATMGEDRSVPVERASKVKAQTLVMDGNASLGPMPFMRATAEALNKTIPNSQHRVLEGQAHNVDAKALAPVLVEFFKTSEEASRESPSAVI